MAVYQLNPSQLQSCTGEQFLTPFQINIVFLDGEPTVPVTMTSIITHTNFGQSSRDAGILSVRFGGCDIINNILPVSLFNARFCLSLYSIARHAPIQ